MVKEPGWFEYIIIWLLIVGGIFGELALGECQAPKVRGTHLGIALLVAAGLAVSIRRIALYKIDRRRKDRR
jgi:hypothetical protein